MPIYTNLKLIFIHIPKNAGTSVCNYLDKKDNNVILKCNSLKQDIDIEDVHLNHYTYLEIINCNIIDNYNEYTFFAVVRNPYYKLLSALQFAGIITNNTTIIMLTNILNILFNKSNLSIVKMKYCKCKYIRYYSFCVNYNTLYIEMKHLECQSLFLKNKDNEIENKIKILYLEDLTNEILNKLNITDFTNKDNCGKIINYDNLLNPDIKTLIYNYYKEDFINFNYKF